MLICTYTGCYSIGLLRCTVEDYKAGDMMLATITLPRVTVQERVTREIASAIQEAVHLSGVDVVIEAS